MPDSEKETPPLHVRWGNRAFVLLEDAIYVSIAALLGVGAVVLVVRAGMALFDGAQDEGPDALLDTLDAILLVFIFVELLYAVRITLKERQIVAEPFLIAGILVCIKEIVVLAVKGANEYIGKGPEFARAMVEVGLLGLLVLTLAATGVLLRRKEKEPEENSNTDSANP
ncbi:MAG: hypothetical protein JWN88_314 [Frankiales bacterium]|jgi:uncharacterized membrane protein (DUF373 family)|nr:hypothetical protein [Frankiales bacterium]